ncbi:MAG: agmatine deiminase family protein [Candidatus Margulisiibacteriota bacterium]|nr:MAG: agmatine deiminase [Candidatus Margulisbacteria bacterium GWD2_39_127]OGI02409.1 MAG: agmatine deiminase [Candidatus Margulisbacteria bacterium GWF2_38_17]OGI08542.1 MAG: agmatine deiminase [Candidatus Margulisbacteria bacterium GWE2_39_32]PZM78193.1 MAG: agmatine deiminase family protein [Candidatus Margulisiibacteriota bacterium]HAR63454.1 agmatine deiminase [Candidatus Margulisiibacteriota bacterium]
MNYSQETILLKPSELGYYMPPEWDLHYGTWLSYPHNTRSFFDKLEKVRESFLEFVKHLARGEAVHINVNNEEMKKDLENRLAQKKITTNVSAHIFPTNDTWCRDHGAIFIKNKKTGNIAATNWMFNAWGEKYPYELDNNIPNYMAEYLKIKQFRVGQILEGGSIDTNGEGILLTTTACLLNKNRNPHLSKFEIENNLKEYLGIHKVLWLGDGVAGDDTDGHVDDIARFINKNTIVTVIENNKNDINYEALKENYERLQHFTDMNGKKFSIIPLQMPDPVYHREERLPASYANFYISNKTIIVPIFNCSNDQLALDTLHKLFPDRAIVGIDASDLVVGLGTFHCLSQQIPYGIKL